MRCVLCLLIVIGLFACKKELPEETGTNGTVLGKGMDCGDTYLIKLDKAQANTPDFDHTYYAVNLPDSFKVGGLRLKVDVRPPTAEEAIICTTRGISYPQIVVVKID